MKKTYLFDITADLLRILSTYKQKPFFPVWGELFCLLWSVKRKAEIENCDVIAYSIYPVGQIIYHAREKLFVAHVPEFNIKMTLEELIQMILRGAMLPANEISIEKRAPSNP